MPEEFDKAGRTLVYPAKGGLETVAIPGTQTIEMSYGVSDIGLRSKISLWSNKWLIPQQDVEHFLI